MTHLNFNKILRCLQFLSEYVRSNINFHQRNQEVDLDMLEMFFSFQCPKYDESGWLNVKLFKKRDVIAQNDNTFIQRYCDTLCTAVLYNDWSLQMGQMGPKMTLGTLTMQ